MISDDKFCEISQQSCEEATKINVLDGKPAMSSLRIAEVTGKRHLDVTRDIKSTIESMDGDVSRFAHIYLDSKNRKETFYILPEREFMIVVIGYSVKYRIKLIDELHEHRKSNNTLQLSQNLPAALRALSLENKILIKTYIEQAEYIRKSDKIVAEAGITVGFSTNQNLRQYATELSNTNVYGEKINIMPNVLRDLLKYSGYLCQDGSPCSGKSRRFFEWKDKGVKHGNKTIRGEVLYMNSTGQKHYAARILSFFRDRVLYLKQRSGRSEACSIEEVTKWRKKIGLKTDNSIVLPYSIRRENERKNDTRDNGYEAISF